MCSWSSAKRIICTPTFVLTVLRRAVAKGEPQVAPVHVFDGNSDLRDRQGQCEQRTAMNAHSKDDVRDRWGAE